MINRFLAIIAVVVLIAGLNSCCCSEDINKRVQADFHVGYGEQSMKEGDYKGAIKSFEKAIKIMPSYPSSYYFKGRALKALGNDQKANENFEKSILLYKKFLKEESGELFYNELADAYENIGRNSDAIDALEKVVLLDPSQRKKVEKKIKELKAKIKSLKDDVESAVGE